MSNKLSYFLSLQVGSQRLSSSISTIGSIDLVLRGIQVILLIVISSSRGSYIDLLQRVYIEDILYQFYISSIYYIYTIVLLSSQSIFYYYIYSSLRIYFYIARKSSLNILRGYYLLILLYSGSSIINSVYSYLILGVLLIVTILLSKIYKSTSTRLS